MTHYCKICGKAVDPQVDILFGALGKPFFAAHKDTCAPFVRETTYSIKQLGWHLLQARQPALAANLVSGLGVVLRVAAAIQGPPPESKT